MSDRDLDAIVSCPHCHGTEIQPRDDGTIPTSDSDRQVCELCLGGGTVREQTRRAYLAKINELEVGVGDWQSLSGGIGRSW